ncbi:hypothetical protein OS493_012663 [Desmophyllum pertusum]|uniref:Uncharacterized protein n=1 Tax=Desmophyllum pertusum TaxID=174260 RepID=A0A9X0CZA0_9CNID|nr:hypothetical protein OS493_012663 [Desmophyllum pertusum]
MVGGLSGLGTAVVARPVEKGRNIRPVPATTRNPREVERIVRENPGKARDVTMENAKIDWGTDLKRDNQINKMIWKQLGITFNDGK